MTVYVPPSDCVTRTWAPAGSMTFWPLGIRVASHSRRRVICSLGLICRLSFSMFRIRSLLDSSLRRDCYPLPFQRGLQGMPGQARAFHPRGELTYPRQNCEFSQLRGIEFCVSPSGKHGMDLLEKGLRFGLGLALNAVGHDRGGSFGNRAARALKANVSDHFIFQARVYRELVTAQGIIAFRCPVRSLQLVEVARPPIMVKDDFLVEFAQVRH